MAQADVGLNRGLERPLPARPRPSRGKWWDDASHVETLCALVVWRDWIDQLAGDPRYELAFQAQLADYGRALPQEGGSLTSGWIPGAPPDAWAC